MANPESAPSKWTAVALLITALIAIGVTVGSWEPASAPGPAPATATRPQARGAEPAASQPEEPATPVRSEVAAGDPAAPPPPTSLMILVGRVLDPAGRPVPGAEVGSTPRQGSAASVASALDGRIPVDGTAAFEPMATAGPGGAFRIETERRQLTLRTGGRHAPLQVQPIDGTRARWDGLVLVCAPAVTFSGVVQNEVGAPIGSAAITVLLRSPVEFPLPLDRHAEASFREADCDAAGVFQLAGLPANGANLYIQAEGFATRVMTAPAVDTAGEIVTMQPIPQGTRTVSGIVLDHFRRLVVDATVGLADDIVRTDGYGTFRLELGVDRYVSPKDSLFAGKPGFRPLVLPGFGARVVNEGSSVTGLELQLPGPAMAISGRVLHADGRPAAGALVYPWNVERIDAERIPEDYCAPADRSRNYRIGGTCTYAETDAIGEFRLTGLRDRDYELRVFDPKTLLAMTSHPVAAGTDDTALYWPPAPFREQVSGTVLDRDDNPVADVVVKFQVEVARSGQLVNHTSKKLATTDSNGQFSATDVPRLWCELAFTGDTVMNRRFQLAADDDGNDLRIVVERRCHFRIELDAGHLPADEAQLLNDAGETLTITQFSHYGSRSRSRAFLEEGKSPVLAVSER